MIEWKEIYDAVNAEAINEEQLKNLLGVLYDLSDSDRDSGFNIAVATGALEEDEDGKYRMTDESVTTTIELDSDPGDGEDKDLPPWEDIDYQESYESWAIFLRSEKKLTIEAAVDGLFTPKQAAAMAEAEARHFKREKVLQMINAKHEELREEANEYH